MKDGAIDMDGYDVPVSYGQADYWWLRSPDTFSGTVIVVNAFRVWSDGGVDYDDGVVDGSYGQADYWWLRSPSTNVSSNACRVYSSGDVGYSYYVGDSFGRILHPLSGHL